MGAPKPAAAMLAALFAATVVAGARRRPRRVRVLPGHGRTRGATGAGAQRQPDEAALARCRQIIRDWTLRESRMSVDENGKPLR